MVEVVVESKHAFLLRIAIAVDVLEKLNFVQGLIDIILIVGDNLHAIMFAIFKTQYLYCSRELSLSKYRKNLVFTCNHIIDDNLEVLMILKSSFILIEDDLHIIHIVDSSIVFDGVEAIL